MKNTSLIDRITDAINLYIGNFDRFDSNPQLRINPMTLDVAVVDGSDMINEIAESDETVEDAAGAQGAESEDATDYQVKRNPDFFPVKSLIFTNSGNKTIPDPDKISKIAASYQ